MKMFKKITLLFISIILICIAVAPLFGTAFIPTHDGEYHIIRFWQFYKNLETGVVFPRWAPDLNSTYGVPLFTFQYPLSNYIGSLYHFLGFEFTQSVRLVLATGFIVACLGCFMWLQSVSKNVRIASFATSIFAMVPYWFVDLYIRGSVGEVLAIACVMWALYFQDAKKYWLLALMIGLLVISHNILAFVFVPIFALKSIVFDKKSLPWIALGILSASIFWIPALAERAYVSDLSPVDVADHFPTILQLIFPTWGSGFSQPGSPDGEMSQQIGIMPLLLLGISLLILFNQKSQFQKNSHLVFYLIIAFVSIFFMTEYALPIWKFLPMVSYIQYPWRLMSILLPVTAYIAANVFERMHVSIQGIIAILACVLSFTYMQPVVYQPRSDTHYLTQDNFIHGTSSLGNSFSTKWLPYVGVVPDKIATLEQQVGDITMLTLEPTRIVFQVHTPIQNEMILQKSFYPGWKAYINAASVPIHFEDGRMHISVPVGVSVVMVQFEDTLLRTLSTILTLVTLSTIIGSGILAEYAHRI